jgi:hypothetical protein
MKKMTAAWLAGVWMIVTAGSLAAHHSLAQFDTTTAVTVKGTIVRFELINPHSVIFVDQKRADGQLQRWAVDGPSARQLSGLGINKDAVKVGDVIEVCGYVTKEGVESQRTINTEPISLSLKATTPKSMTGKIMNAEMVVMSDGKKQTWSDYGQHLCLGPDYHDFHK